MINNSASMRFRVIMFILTIGMVSFAFIQSLMPGTISSEESGSVLDFLINILKSFGVDADISEFIIRKMAHFTEYAVIGMLMLSCAYSFDRLKPYKYYAQVLFFGLATAVCDETIQLYVPDRAGQVNDVLLDFSGMVTGAFIMLVIYMIYVRIKNRKSKQS